MGLYFLPYYRLFKCLNCKRLKPFNPSCKTAHILPNQKYVCIEIILVDIIIKCDLDVQTMLQFGSAYVCLRFNLLQLFCQGREPSKTSSCCDRGNATAANICCSLILTALQQNTKNNFEPHKTKWNDWYCTNLTYTQPKWDTASFICGALFISSLAAIPQGIHIRENIWRKEGKPGKRNISKD